MTVGCKSVSRHFSCYPATSSHVTCPEPFAPNLEYLLQGTKCHSLDLFLASCDVNLLHVA